MIIYAIQNNINGKIYVGQTKQMLEHRLCQHRVKCRFPIGAAFRKYGRDAFTVYILDYAKTQEELDQKEIYWISDLKSKYPIGYNIVDGGGGALNMPEDIKDKIRAKKIGKKMSEEARRKMSAFQKGRKKSEEHKRKIALAHIGMTYSDETKNKISIAKSGMVYSEEARKNMREAQRGRVHSPASLEKFSRSMKAHWAENREKMLASNCMVKNKNLSVPWVKRGEHGKVLYWEVKNTEE